MTEQTPVNPVQLLRARLSEVLALAEHHRSRSLALAVVVERQAEELKEFRGQTGDTPG